MLWPSPSSGPIARAPIRLAARPGQVDIVEMLLKVGAEVTGPRARRCIVRGLWFGHDDIANQLIPAGADVECEDPGLKMTALDVANSAGFEETVRIINDRLSDQQ